MKRATIWCLGFALVGLFTLELFAPRASAADAKVTVIATVSGRGHSAPPELTPEDVLVYQDNDRRPVVSWVPAEGENGGLDLAILTDDSLDATVGVQFSDLKQFIRSFPATTRVAVAYAAHGSANVRQDFTTDHQLAAQALRLPVGRIEEGSSIYQAVVDWLEKWPAGEKRGAILLVSDGLDLFRGAAESSPGLNQDLQEAIDKAQQKHVLVYTLFANGAARFTRNFYLLTNGQGSLGRLAFETGGEAYFQGFETPLSFSPYLEQLSKTLGEQYLLTFKANLGKTAGYRGIRVTTEQPGVEITAPARVYVPAAP